MTAVPSPSKATEEVVERDYHSLHNHPDNPRGHISESDPRTIELADSIVEKGVIEPLIITPNNEILAGNRRHIACHVAFQRTRDETFLRHIPCIVRKLKSGEDPLEIMLHENLQRASLSLTQEARAFKLLIDRRNLSIAECARRTAAPQSFISSRLLITKLYVEVQALYDASLLPIKAAATLVKITDKDQQLKLATMLARKERTVEELQELVRTSKVAVMPRRHSNPVPIPRKKTTAIRKSRPRDLSQTDLEPTRADALTALERANGRSIKLFDIRVLANSICTACAMIDRPEVCRACVLPRFILGIVGRSSETRH